MRLFLAIEIPAALRAAVEKVQTRLRAECRGWKWAAPGSIHLTLRFLGNVFPDDVPEQTQRFREAAGVVPPIRYRVAGVGVFPRRSQPRILWAGIEESGGTQRLADLAARLEQAARELGFEPEERAFRPHLTLARAERDGRADPPPEGIALEPLEATCAEIVLFRSELLPAGARYTPLTALPLAGDEAA